MLACMVAGAGVDVAGDRLLRLIAACQAGASRQRSPSSMRRGPASEIASLGDGRRRPMVPGQDATSLVENRGPGCGSMRMAPGVYDATLRA